MSDKHTPDMYKDHRQRLRKTASENGAASLDNYKLLELFLFGVLPRIDTYPLAHRLLDRFGTLDGVFSAGEEELREVEGVGPKTAAHITSAGAVITKTVLENLTVVPLDSETTAFPVLLWLLRNAPTDTALVLALDGKYNYTGHRILPPGAVVGEYSSQIKRLCGTGAKRIVFAHRHPEGAMRPTPDDVKVTDMLERCCEEMGTILAGHYIVAGNKVVSVITDEYLRAKNG